MVRLIVIKLKADIPATTPERKECSQQTEVGYGTWLRTFQQEKGMKPQS